MNRSAKGYEKLFGLTKPERTTKPSARNVEIEENRKKVDGGYIYALGERRWMNPEMIAWIIQCRNIENSRRKRER